MNSRTKKVLAVLCVAGLVLAWRVYGLLERYLPASVQALPTTAPALTDADAAGKTVVPENTLARWESQRAVAEQPWGRDPFADAEPVMENTRPVKPDEVRAPSSAAPTAAAFGFTGVSESKGKWLAVVRGRIVRVGDEIDGKYKVVEIDRRSITLAAEGWTYRYELGAEDVSVRPASEEQ